MWCWHQLLLASASFYVSADANENNVNKYSVGGHTNTERSFLLILTERIRRQIRVDVLEEVASQENAHLLVCVQNAPPPRTYPKKCIRPSLYTQDSEPCASTHNTPHTTKIQSEKKCNNRHVTRSIQGRRSR